MSYAVEIGIGLGASKAGLTDLRARLVDATGANVGSAISTGFREIGNGWYHWTNASMPDGFTGGIKFFRAADTSTILSYKAIHPRDAQDLDTLNSRVPGTVATSSELNNAVSAQILPAITTVGGQVAGVDTKATAIQTAVAGVDTKASAIQTAVAAVSATATATQTAVAGVDTKATAIQTAVATIDAKASSLQTSVGALDTKATAIQTAVAAVGTQATGIDTKATAIQAAVAGLPEATQEAVWAAQERTLTAGEAPDAATIAEAVTTAVWAAADRTLTESPAQADIEATVDAVFLRSIGGGTFAEAIEWLASILAGNVASNPDGTINTFKRWRMGTDLIKSTITRTTRTVETAP